MTPKEHFNWLLGKQCKRGTGRSCLFSAWFSLERITVIILQDNNIMWELMRTRCFALPKKSLACFLQLSYPFRIHWKQIKTSTVQFGAKVLDAWKDAPAEVFHLMGNHELYNFNRPGWGWKHPETKGQDFIAVIANSQSCIPESTRVNHSSTQLHIKKAEMCANAQIFLSLLISSCFLDLSSAPTPFSDFSVLTVSYCFCPGGKKRKRSFPIFAPWLIWLRLKRHELAK